MIVTILIVVILLVMKNVSKHYFSWMCFFVLLLSSVYLLWSPPTEADLHWHYRFFEDVSLLSFKDVISMNPDNIIFNTSIYTTKFISQCPIFALAVWCISLAGIKELEPFLIISSMYIFSIYALWDICKSYKKNITKSTIYVCFLFLICTLSLFNLGGLRNPWAFTIFAFIAYFDFWKGKRLGYCLPMYLIPCLIHPASYILLAFRIATVLFSSKRAWILYLLVPTIVYLIPYLLSYFGTLGSLFNRIVETSQNYFLEGSSVVNGYNRAATLILYVAITFICFVTKRLQPQRANICNYMIAILIFAFLNLHNYDVFVRFAYFLIPLTTLLLSEYRNLNLMKEKKVLPVVLFISAFCLMFYGYMHYTSFDTIL